MPARRITEIYRRRGQVYLLLARYPEAIAEAEHMCSHARAAGDRQSEGEALADPVSYHFLTHSWDHIPQVQRLGEEALVLAQETGDERMMARSLISLSTVDQVHGKLRAGDAKLERALRIGKTRGFQDVITHALLWLGAAANWRGELRRALTLLVDIVKDLEDKGLMRSEGEGSQPRYWITDAGRKLIAEQEAHIG
jgi:hypothetical protein